MKKKNILLGLALIPTLVLASCKINSNNIPNEPGQNPYNPVTDGGSSIASTISTSNATDASSNYVEIDSDFTLYNETDFCYISPVENEYTITKAGEYTLTGKLENGRIYINATEDDEIILNLNGVSMSSNKGAIIYANLASKVEISAKADTYNELYDDRISSTDDSTAPIYALCDLKLKGKGSLLIDSIYNNGIHSKDDLEIKNLTLKVEAPNNALKGNDSVTIESGNVIAISTGSDGIKTNNSDLSSKGNQRGTVSILGGTVDIYACEDGIDSAYNVDINGSEATVNIYTSLYSEYSSSHYVSAGTDIYLRLSSYSSSDRYAAYYYNTDGTYEWVDLSYSGTQSVSSGNSNRPGGSSTKTYYLYKGQAPTGYSNVKIYKFSSSQTENSTTDYTASTSGGSVNTSMNMYAVTSTSGTTLSGDWTMYSTSSSDYSAKGIKADNEINVIAGTVVISSSDDAFHANYGAVLENGETGLGNINITGGAIQVVSGDDGMHADNTLTISSGYVNIKNSHEGLEANQIKIAGGETYVSGTDDGVNAGKSMNQTPLIEVSGGILDVIVSNGDTDGIDSNGNYKQTGGFVITRNPTTDTSGNMGALDIDGTFTMTGGTFVALGPVSAVPSNYNYVRYGSTGGMGGGFNPFGGSSSSSSVTISKGSYTVSNTSIAFEATTTYYGLFIASNELVVGTSYTLSGGSTISWTQSQSQTTVN